MKKILNPKGTIIPTVYEEDRSGMRTYFDIFSRLLKDRIIFLSGYISDELANLIIAELIFLEKENPKEDIQVYIQSPGGSVSAGLSMYDAFQYVKPEIITIGMGAVASMASILLSAGAKGKRYILPHAEVMIHQISVPGLPHLTASDLVIQTTQIEKEKKKLNSILSKHTGKPISVVEKDTERDFWMTAEEAKKYGIVDKIL